LIPATLKWIFLAGILAAPVSAAEGWTILDGDTLRSPSGVTIRIANIDAPEAAGRCQCPAECSLAAKATAYVRASLSHAGVVTLRAYPRPVDRYGRQLRYVIVDGRDLGELLIAEGLARKWEGRRRSWCPAPPPW
jgi:micrococcal nuclease